MAWSVCIILFQAIFFASLVGAVFGLLATILNAKSRFKVLLVTFRCQTNSAKEGQNEQQRNSVACIDSNC